MAYLTLVVNPADDIAAKRVVNVPRRGVGKSTVERVEQFAREMDMPFLDAAELAIVDPELRASTQRALGEFVGLLKEARPYAGDVYKRQGCHLGCGILMYTDDEGRLVKVEGDPENPFNQGRLCVRCLDLPEVVYSPDRILHPLKDVYKRQDQPLASNCPPHDPQPTRRTAEPSPTDPDPPTRP